MPRQEPGLKWSRALPYDLGVHGQVNAAKGTITLHLHNPGRAGAVFRVSDARSPDAPRNYTVEAGKHLHDTWLAAADGRYDLVVSGPGGFHRRFAGDVTHARVVGAEAHVRHETDAQGALRLVIENRGSLTLVVVVRPNAYTKQAPRRHALRPGAVVDDHWDVAESLGWYDLSVTVEGDATFVRRAAGRVETGRPSVSDPATLTQE